MDMNMETEQLTVTVSAKEDEKLTFEELTERADEVVDKISGISGVDSIGAWQAAVESCRWAAVRTV